MKASDQPIQERQQRHPLRCVACGGCAFRVAEPVEGVSARGLNLATGLNLGMPLAGLFVGGSVGETLVGGAWWAVGGFAAASTLAIGMRHRVGVWLRDELG